MARASRVTARLLKAVERTEQKVDLLLRQVDLLLRERGLMTAVSGMAANGIEDMLPPTDPDSRDDMDEELDDAEAETAVQPGKTSMKKVKDGE